MEQDGIQRPPPQGGDAHPRFSSCIRSNQAGNAQAYRPQGDCNSQRTIEPVNQGLGSLQQQVDAAAEGIDGNKEVQQGKHRGCQQGKVSPLRGSNLSLIIVLMRRNYKHCHLYLIPSPMDILVTYIREDR
ncbi:hypothetical protein SDC9_155550 [bioreactor metagenome]|uniref:Uncharacterized protein n=1 Tax=bioreactor metagenome TaxID=1076179 RepID=A0A645F1T2_9ZZZZ